MGSGGGINEAAGKETVSGTGEGEGAGWLGVGWGLVWNPPLLGPASSCGCRQSHPANLAPPSGVEGEGIHEDFLDTLAVRQGPQLYVFECDCGFAQDEWSTVGEEAVKKDDFRRVIAADAALPSTRAYSSWENVMQCFRGRASKLP